MTFRHVSAMLHEAVACLACRPGGTYVDGTLGGAGHARAICQQMMPDGRLVGIDQDADAVANARRVLEPYSDHIQLFHGNFSHLPDYLDQLKITAVDGILLDIQAEITPDGSRLSLGRVSGSHYPSGNLHHSFALKNNGYYRSRGNKIY